MTKRSLDLTEYNINIDELLDVYKQVQEEAGIDTGLVEKDIEIDNHGNAITVKTTKEQKEKEKECSGQCSECENASHNASIFDTEYTNRLGNFEDFRSPEIDAGDSLDDKYICEYCTELGCNKEYTPYICDTCNACEECAEYGAEECSGCTYSTYRTGRLYSDELRARGENAPTNEEVEELLDILLVDDAVPERLSSDKSFSVMDYDHKY